MAAVKPSSAQPAQKPAWPAWTALPAAAQRYATQADAAENNNQDA